MADTKITALAAIATVDPAADVLPIVDISDTSMAASGTTKKITSNQILGSGGTATLASATITGAATVGTTLGVTGVSTLASAVVTGALTSGTTTLVSHAAGYTGKVGIGTATPAYKLDVSSATASNQLRLSGSNQNTMVFANAAAGASNGFLVGRSYASDDANNWFIYDITASAIRLFIGATGYIGIGTPSPSEVLNVASGNVKLDNGNVIIGTSGKGIDFSAVTGGTGTATGNVLNDYEVGTWTPVLTFATPGTLAVTYNARSGTYTKIGNLVTVIFRVSCAPAGIIKGTASGSLSITGLPFTVGSAYSYSYADLGSAITDITTGSCALMVPITTSISFETLAIIGTRIERDSASLTAASFAVSNGSFVTITGTISYTV